MRAGVVAPRAMTYDGLVKLSQITVEQIVEIREHDVFRGYCDKFAIWLRSVRDDDGSFAVTTEQLIKYMNNHYLRVIREIVEDIGRQRAFTVSAGIVELAAGTLLLTGLVAAPIAVVWLKGAVGAAGAAIGVSKYPSLRDYVYGRRRVRKELQNYAQEINPDFERGS